MTSLTVTKLLHVNQLVDDFDAARAFYARLGFVHDGVEGPDQLTERPKVRLRAKL